MSGKLSFRDVFKMGLKLRGKKKFKPKFTAQDFVKGCKSESHVLAEGFVDFVNEYYKKQKFKNLTEFVGAEIDHKELIKAVTVDEQVVFVKNEKTVGSYTYKQVAELLEYGRKDLGLLPHPILRVAFKDYREEYKKKVRDFVTHKD